MNNFNFACATVGYQPIFNDAPVWHTGRLPRRSCIARKNIRDNWWGNTARGVLERTVHLTIVQTPRTARCCVGDDVVVIHGIWGE